MHSSFAWVPWMMGIEHICGMGHTLMDDGHGYIALKHRLSNIEYL